MKRLLFVAVIVGLAAAIRYLPWWASTALVVATPIVGWMLVKRFAMQFFLGAFKAKSAVLAGATARIHSIEAAPPFKPDDDDDMDDLFEDIEQPFHWVYVDLDITVAERTDSPMSFWEPDDLALVAENADPNDFESDDEVGQVYGAEVMENGAWVTVDGKLAGSQRVRLHVAAYDGVDRFRIRYYFELLKSAG